MQCFMSHGGNNHYRRIAAVRAQQAEEAARRAREEADRLAIIAWNERMRIGGPSQPSPTVGDAMRYGFRFLRVRCSCCHQAAFIEIARIDRPPVTPVWKLEGGLACQPCRRDGARAPRGTVDRLTITRDFDE
jgi:hypothetical protein